MKTFLALTIFALHLYGRTEAKDPLPFTTCSRRWEKVGCFHDSLAPRPLPELLLNDRDQFSTANDGHLLDWHKWEQSLHSLACRCAAKARARGYKFFGLQFYGECWGGPNDEMMFSKDGPSNNCIQSLYKPQQCVKQDPLSECVGGPNTNYIYRLMDNTPKPQSPDIDGGWSSWSDWTACSKTCGKGVTRRERECNNPLPQGKGRDCEEENGNGIIETAECHLMACPVCGNTMDVALVIDSSSSVRRENFGKIKEFLVKLVDVLDISEKGTHVGAIRYNHKAEVMWDFNNRANYDKDNLKKAIRGIKFKPGATRTDIAMELAASSILGGKDSRGFVPHVALVLTDGKTGHGSKPYRQVAQIIRNKVPDIRVVSIGVGPFIDEAELTQIALGDGKEVFKLDNFNDLSKRLKEILNTFCKERAERSKQG